MHTSRAEVKILVPVTSREEIRPVYTGPLTGIVSEGDDIGTLVLTLAAEVVGGGSVTYQLVENTGDLFELDSNSGELRTARAIDRESVALNGFLPVTIRATARNGQSVEQVLTVIVEDVNDEDDNTEEGLFSCPICEAVFSRSVCKRCVYFIQQYQIRN